MLKIISKLTFLHKIASIFVNLIPFFILHNLSKYYELRKSFELIKMDKIEGDYCEFGCFTGASLRHAISITKNNNFLIKKKLYGFDSFEGFPEEVHSEFKSEKFSADYESVKKLEIETNGRCKIIKGFFSDTLKSENINNDIKKISFAFIDCDLAISSTTVFDFIKDKLVNGSVIMIDDFFNIDENGKSIKEEFIKRFELNKNVFLFSTYGLGGVVYKYYKI